MWTRQGTLEEQLGQPMPTGDPSVVVSEVMRSLADPSHKPLSSWTSHRRVRGLVAMISTGMAIFGFMLGLQGGAGLALLTAIKLPLIWLGAAAISLPVLWLLSSPMSTEHPGAPEPVTEPLLRALASGSLAVCCLGTVIPVIWLGLLQLHGGTVDAAWFAYRRVFLAGILIALVGVILVARSLLQRFRWSAVLAYGCTTALASVQLAWLLRPIVGSPGTGLVIFRDIESNGLAQAFIALWAVLS